MTLVEKLRGLGDGRMWRGEINGRTWACTNALLVAVQPEEVAEVVPWPPLVEAQVLDALSHGRTETVAIGNVCASNGKLWRELVMVLSDETVYIREGIFRLVGGERVGWYTRRGVQWVIAKRGRATVAVVGRAVFDSPLVVAMVDAEELELCGVPR